MTMMLSTFHYRDRSPLSYCGDPFPAKSVSRSVRKSREYSATARFSDAAIEDAEESLQGIST
jgi:hypothetical protein